MKTMLSLQYNYEGPRKSEILLIYYIQIYLGVSPSGKAAGFDPVIRRFESFHPRKGDYCEK